MNMRILICEIASLELIEELTNLCLVEEQGGDNDESDCRPQEAHFWKVEFRKRLCLHQSGKRVVYQVDAALAGWQKREQERGHHRPESVMGDQRRDDGNNEKTGNREDAKNVEIFIPPAEKAAKPLHGRGVISDALAEQRQTFGKQVIADMHGPAAVARVHGRGCDWIHAPGLEQAEQFRPRLRRHVARVRRRASDRCGESRLPSARRRQKGLGEGLSRMRLAAPGQCAIRNDLNAACCGESQKRENVRWEGVRPL